jgi:hypothetical protein
LKLPSITQVWAELKRTSQRFPLTLISAVILTVVSIILIEQGETSEPSVLYSILLTTILALPLLTALKLAAERVGSNSSLGWILQPIGVVLLLVYAFTVPVDLPGAPLVHMFRFFAFAIVCCLLVSFLPFRQKGESTGFWQFNKIIVFRIVLAEVFAFVLYSGLTLALAALDNLFGIDIPGKRYFELWILIQGLFAVTFVLSGIPGNLSELDQVADYPRSVKVLGQYLLSPLVLVYFVILYAYIAKIIITWSWPQGWVGRLILGFSATGILAFFVLDPLRERAEALWIKKASRWYYLILLPLIVVLFLALWRRISDYGLTEDRYLGLAIGVWLALTAGYFLLSRAKSIKTIPASLCVFTFLISVGPWGMFSVSEQSQIHRLKGILEADSILVNGKVQKAPLPVPEDHRVEISGILSYLHEVHGYNSIESWFAQSLSPDTAGSRSQFKSPEEVAELMGVEYSRWRGPQMGKYFSVSADLLAPVSISGFDHMLRVGYRRTDAKVNVPKQPADSDIEATTDSAAMSLFSEKDSSNAVVIPLHPVLDSMASAQAHVIGSSVPAEKATFDYENTGFRTRVVMLNANFERQDSTVVVNSYDALILYSQKSGDQDNSEK